MSKPLSWFELSQQPEGTKVVFTKPWDIFPECVVPKGATCIIEENGLNEIWCCISVRTDDVDIQESLLEWDGCVYLNGPEDDPYEPDTGW